MQSQEATPVSSLTEEQLFPQRIDALPREAMTNESFSMYRVPAYIRESRQIYYEPRFLSIGPYHHGKPHLQGMEKHKMLYLLDFLSRSNTARKSYLMVVKEQLPRLKTCYFDGIAELRDDELAEILLLDGCFILEFLFKYMEGKKIFGGVGWMLPLIRSDFLMLENQIPFFLLQRLFTHLLFSIIHNKRGDIKKIPSLVEICALYLAREKVRRNASIADFEIYHLLHLHHCLSIQKPGLPALHNNVNKSLFPNLHKVLKLVAVAATTITCFRKKKETSVTERTPRTIPSVTKLKESGVKFQSKNTDNILDITFKNGILEIPFLSIQDSTKSQMMNLVAFEQCMPVEKRFLSSYVGFMDDIIDKPKDVSILCKCGILENKLTSDKEAAAFFNQLSDCAYIDYEGHYLAGLFKDIHKYCSSDWHEWRAKLTRDYFSNPWAILSVVAAVILLILTFLQTFFGMYAYYHPLRS